MEQIGLGTRVVDGLGQFGTVTFVLSEDRVEVQMDSGSTWRRPVSGLRPVVAGFEPGPNAKNLAELASALASLSHEDRNMAKVSPGYRRVHDAATDVVTHGAVVAAMQGHPPQWTESKPVDPGVRVTCNGVTYENVPNMSGPTVATLAPSDLDEAKAALLHAVARSATYNPDGALKFAQAYAALCSASKEGGE